MRRIVFPLLLCLGVGCSDEGSPGDDSAQLGGDAGAVASSTSDVGVGPTNGGASGGGASGGTATSATATITPGGAGTGNSPRGGSGGAPGDPSGGGASSGGNGGTEPSGPGGGSSDSGGNGPNGNAGAAGDAPTGTGGDGPIEEMTDAGAGGAGGAPPDVSSCEEPEVPAPSGERVEISADDNLEAALAGLEPGDRLVLSGGDYGDQQIRDVGFDELVFIEAAPGEDVSFDGLTFRGCDHIVLDGLQVHGTLELNASSDFVLRNLVLDGGNSGDAALQLQGQDSGGASHDVQVLDSILRGGGRTVFVLGRFAPSDNWNHHIEFRRNQISCGSAVCFQLSGARDFLLEENEIQSDGSNGVLTAGATRVTIARNRFTGSGGTAMQLATPGAEWDNYSGVENMISSDITVVNNIVTGFSNGIQFDATTNISVVNNTFATNNGLTFNHRTPHDQSDNVILDGNSEIRVWNNILSSLRLSDQGRPDVESNNLVTGDGGGGEGLITDDPDYEDDDFRLSPTSPARNAGIQLDGTPPIDFDGALRDELPDIGAREHDGTAPECPE